VLNVVTNAIDAASESEQAGRVDVAAHYWPKDGKLAVRIRDNGPGVPPDQVEQLFRPFVSLKRGRGTGLGLPVSQKILGEHGGEVVVDSIPGEGSRFTLELPAVPPGSDQPTQQL